MNYITAPSSYIAPHEHLSNLLNHPWYRVINKLHVEIIHATHDFYRQEGIEPTLFPITTGSVSSPMGLGSDSSPVKINLHNNDVYLADSMQFCLEIGARLNQRGAYYIMPTFRGEDVDARHLNEFTHSEAEIQGSLEDIIELVERYIKFMISHFLKNCREEILSVTGTISHLEAARDKKFPHIEFSEAFAQLEALGRGYTYTADGAPDITPEGERILMETHSEFLWLTHLPWKLVPFYQSAATDPTYANAADLLAGIGEILGSGQRVYDGNALDKSLHAHNVKIDGYEWYRDMHENYPLQTSGFGLGVERFIAWVLDHDDIRDCTLLLRDHKQVILP